MNKYKYITPQTFVTLVETEAPILGVSQENYTRNIYSDTNSSFWDEDDNAAFAPNTNNLWDE